VSRISVLIADDHPIFRRGLRDLVGGHGRFEVVAEADNGLSALAALRSLRPAIGIVDVSMPGLDGLEVLAQTRTWPDPPAIVLLTLHDELAQRALDGGAAGYVLKENAEEEILDCLAAVCAGRRFVSRSIPSQRVAGGGVEAISALAELTATERRILRLLAQFKTSREIAEVLCVSPRTVQNHRAHMCTKLGLQGSKALLQFALAHVGEL
jgi:DNA-binding NarL/FixJ family response regulator